MNLFEKFLDLTNEIGIERDDLVILDEDNENFKLVTFGEKIDDSIIYNVALVFYDDDDSVEIYVRKPIENYDELTLLRNINEQNASFSGISFYVEENLLNAQSVCRSNNNPVTVIQQLVQTMETAKEVFPEIEV